VAEHRLGGLEVHALCHQAGGVGPLQVVEPEALVAGLPGRLVRDKLPEAGGDGRRVPDGALGIAQEGEPILRETARPFDLPAEAADARRSTSSTRTSTAPAASTIFDRGTARLVAHEIDSPIPVSEYRQGGESWTYQVSSPAMLPR
jgi:hypothetical protein